MCLDEDVDPNGPCQQYTEANDVLRDLKSNLREDKQLLKQVLASVWRKVMPPPSILHAFHAACLAGCEANVMLLVLPRVRLTSPMHFLASVWRKVMPPPSTLYACHATCLVRCEANVTHADLGFCYA